VIFGGVIPDPIWALADSKISTKGWMGRNTGWAAQKTKNENSYGQIKERVTGRVGPRGLGAGDLTWDDGAFETEIDAALAANNSITTPDGEVAILENTGAASTITFLDPSGINIGVRKVILFTAGNVVINSDLLTGDTGSLAIIANGNITVSPNVGIDRPAALPNQEQIWDDIFPFQLNGMFYATGIFSTGTAGATDKQLKIKGSVTGMNGVNLERQSMGPYPAEFIEFDAKLTKIARDVGLRRIVRQELVGQ